MSLILLLASASACPPQVVEAADVELRWRVTGGVLYGQLHAETTGWIAMGLNDRPALAGSLLVMGAVTDGELRLEEHIATPPTHPRRTAMGGRDGVRHAEGSEEGGTTVIRFELSLEADGVAPRLVGGQPAFLTLAWSTHDAFDHHSARREMVEIQL